MPARRTLPRRRPEEGAELVPADVAAAPPPRGPARGMTPAQLLALQRSGAGNAVLARAFGDQPDTEEDEEEQDAGGGYPLLLTDRPWSEIEPGPGGIPAPFPPAIDLDELPLVIHMPPELLAMLFPQQAPAPPPPEPLLLLEYHPMEPEAPEEAEATPETETEAESEAEQPEAAKEPQRKKKKKRKKGKGGGEQAAATPAEPQSVAAPPAPVQPPAEMSLEEAMAFIGDDKPAKAPKPKQQRAPRPNKAQEEARKKKQEAEKKAEEEDRKRRQEEAIKETALCKDLRDGLTDRHIDLEAARDAKPNNLAHRAIRREADDEAKALAEWLTKDGASAGSAVLRARFEKVNKLILKVEKFEPPETPAQKRTRKFNEVKQNVQLKLSGAEWEGKFGGQTDFDVDKHDPVMRQMIRNEYGMDSIEVPGHEGKKYSGKTKTSKVYYYVTASSHTGGIAYDISLHPWDGNTQLDTVYVLHIPHKPS